MKVLIFGKDVAQIYRSTCHLLRCVPYSNVNCDLPSCINHIPTTIIVTSDTAASIVFFQLWPVVGECICSTLSSEGT